MFAIDVVVTSSCGYFRFVAKKQTSQKGSLKFAMHILSGNCVGFPLHEPGLASNPGQRLGYFFSCLHLGPLLFETNFINLGNSDLLNPS